MVSRPLKRTPPAQSATAAEIRAVGESALTWVMAHLDRFDPSHPWHPDARFRFKVFGELMFILVHLLRSPRYRYDARVAQLVQFVHACSEHYDLVAVVRNEPAGLSILALAEELNLVSGRVSGPHRAEMLRMIAKGYLDAMERVPFRQMDVRYALDCAQIPNGMAAVGTWFCETPAGRAPAVPYLTVTDVYSVTHVIFYITDMGHRPVDAVVPGQSESIRWLLRALLGMAVRQVDLDLTAELLMCASCVGETADSPLSRAAWSTLTRHRMADGALCARDFQVAEWAGRSGEEKERYYFSGCYHTTLVGLAAAALWTSFGA